MADDKSPHGLSHLEDQPEAEEEVLVIDFENLAVINAVVSNVSSWGCRLTSVDVGDLYKSIGIRPKDSAKLVKAQVTSVKGNNAAVVFSKSEKTVSDKRREKRNNVSIQVKVADLEGITEITGTIIDAGNNGCRISAQGLSALPEEVLLTMPKFERPVVAEFAWRNETSGGLRLLWDRATGGDEQDQDNIGED
ncbi:PilZ domain-containing protein [Roseibium aggregatum]|uniref:PilZ domain-containing protein n=1 Tax=Roseibium aggregatum TaxID=187304 RepID=A0A939J585_9HYPH|nr:PilZ domain-containing protein [Roseibium aggregatum]MBN9671474.1 PilZ domain-containing protein [Roseibium aggregatum]